MSSVLTGIIGVVVFLIVSLLGFPIASGMLLVGVVGFGLLTSAGAALNLIAVDLFSSITSYNMSVVAMFTLMGYLALHSGIGAKLFDYAYKKIGHRPGGLAMASVVACTAFGAVCGSGPATTATIGSISFPVMKKHKYDSSLYTASVAAGGGLGLLIPPSMTAIVYGVATEQSIGRIFMAGIGAGILLMLLYMLVIYIQAKRNPNLAPRGEKYSRKERAEAAKDGLIEVGLIFLLSIGGLSVGWFTPTEGGAVAAFAMLVVVLVRKQLNWKKFVAAIMDTVKTMGMVLFIVACATTFGRFIALTQIPAALATLLTGLNTAPWVIMLIIVAIYLVLGMFIDSLPMIMLTIPIFYPVVIDIGYDPIWFGVIITMVCCMGMITPPVGIDVYVTRNVAPDVPLTTIFKGIWPFLFATLAAIAFLIIFPDIALLIPNLLMGAQ
ncbi:MAG: TRAP transporter large permease [Christensenellales bacterium]